VNPSSAACRRAGVQRAAIFLGSAPSTANQMVRGLELERVLLGVVQPGQQIGLYKDALRRLGDRLHYLNRPTTASGSTRGRTCAARWKSASGASRTRTMSSLPSASACRKAWPRACSAGSMCSPAAAMCQTTGSFAWLCCHPTPAFSRTGQSLATERAKEILKARGEQPRQKQNRLIFLAADYDSVSRLKDQVRSMLAWQSIVADIREMKLNLDQFQAKQASKSLEDANRGAPAHGA
jgi:hypothetical protein